MKHPPHRLARKRAFLRDVNGPERSRRGLPAGLIDYAAPMPKLPSARRDFLKSSLAAARMTAGLAGAAALASRPRRVRAEAPAAPKAPPRPARIKFAVIGVNHAHVHRQVEAVTRGGGELVGFYAAEPDLAAAFGKKYPQARLARSEAELLEAKDIQLIASAAIPSERAVLGIQAMRAGKDFLSDKPGATSLKQLADLRKVQAQTGRIYSIMYSERHENRATVKAGELVKQGAIGRVVQTIGLGPHRANLKTRPPWFFEKDRYGGILCDVGSHQFDQFLYFTGSSKAEVVAAQVGNVNHPDHPGFEDFGDVMLRGDRGNGYVRVDWFTPDGLKSWGDCRLVVLGTDGYLEVRKNIDVAGRPGAEHLLVVDSKEARYIDCKDAPLPYGEHLVDDVLNRTETAMPQAHCFYATERALKAQRAARRVGPSV
jgi:predicted dehydrogenase